MAPKDAYSRRMLISPLPVLRAVLADAPGKECNHVGEIEVCYCLEMSGFEENCQIKTR